MRARLINEEGIPWSGKDPTKSKPIGRLITKSLKYGEHTFPRKKYEVVEIHGDIYIVNKWYKQGRVPQIIHKELVEEYIPYINEEFREDSDPVEDMGIGVSAINKKIAKDVLEVKYDLMGEYSHLVATLIIDVSRKLLPPENLNIGDAILDIAEEMLWFEKPRLANMYINFLTILREDIGFILNKELDDIVDNPQNYLNK